MRTLDTDLALCYAQHEDARSRLEGRYENDLEQADDEENEIEDEGEGEGEAELAATSGAPLPTPAPFRVEMTSCRAPSLNPDLGVKTNFALGVFRTF